MHHTDEHVKPRRPTRPPLWIAPVTTIHELTRKKKHIGVVGLGYVGTPLAAALRRHFSVYGFDRDARTIQALRSGVDRTKSVDEPRIREMKAFFSCDPKVLQRCGFVIVTVPTPITTDNTPDLEPLKAAAITVGRNLTRGAVVVVESTVYPGVTEEVVGRIIADESGYVVGQDFHLGYSPERINPGDGIHTLEHVTKVVAAQSDQVVELMTAVYGAVTGGNVFRSASIKTAEAAKVIENTQRDLNIALMNELAMIFDRLGLDTQEVIRTASTKWNFARFEPGLVGGHCIGVDPYYLTHVAEKVGHLPRVILAGRYVNDLMGRYVGERTVSLIRDHRSDAGQIRVLILGFTFKENISDVRNTRVFDVVRTFEEHGVHWSVFDPEADPRDVRELYGFEPLVEVSQKGTYDAIVAAVRHDVFKSMFPLPALRAISVAENPVLIDVKSSYDPAAARGAGFIYWRL